MLNSNAQESTTALNPFNLNEEKVYRAWRERKLRCFPASIDAIAVEIGDPANLTVDEKTAIDSALERANLAIYRCQSPIPDKEHIRLLGGQFGLYHLDANICADENSITSLTAIESGRKRNYIPYTNRRLSWHTDGYYNALDRQIRAIIMHCVTPAAQGGENMYLDHEMLYIALRDNDPELIRAMTHETAMTIPPNIEDGQQIRGEVTGPVFSIDPSGHLHMRYSARTRNIHWRDTEATCRATALMTELLNDSPYILRYTLQENEGVISNNVLHNRTAFEDSDTQKRLLYRARYYERCSTAPATE